MKCATSRPDTQRYSTSKVLRCPPNASRRSAGSELIPPVRALRRGMISPVLARYPCSAFQLARPSVRTDIA
jgi:hypothetical protein